MFFREYRLELEACVGIFDVLCGGIGEKWVPTDSLSVLFGF